MKSILDRSFRYTQSVDTDIRKTFARIRRLQREQARMTANAERSPTVVAIQPRRRSSAL